MEVDEDDAPDIDIYHCPNCEKTHGKSTCEYHPPQYSGGLCALLLAEMLLLLTKKKWKCVCDVSFSLLLSALSQDQIKTDQNMDNFLLHS